MNALGLMLLGSIAHATVFASVGAVLYLALRRSNPATGSLAAAACLLIMAIVSVIVLTPWPRWWTFVALHAAEAQVVPAPIGGSLDVSPLPEQEAASGGSQVATAPRSRPGRPLETVVPSRSPLSIFLGELV